MARRPRGGRPGGGPLTAGDAEIAWATIEPGQLTAVAGSSTFRGRRTRELGDDSTRAGLRTEVGTICDSVYSAVRQRGAVVPNSTAARDFAISSTTTWRRRRSAFT